MVAWGRQGRLLHAAMGGGSLAHLPYGAGAVLASQSKARWCEEDEQREDSQGLRAGVADGAANGVANG